MEKMFRFNFYKEQYYKEIERRNGLYNSLNIPLTIITALFGLISYMLFNYNFDSSFFLNILFLCSISSNIGLSIHIINSFYKTFKYSTLKIFPSGDFLKNEKNSVDEQVENYNSKVNKKERVINEIEFENSLCLIILEMNEALTNDNNTKAEEVSILQKNLLKCFIIAIFSISFFSINNFIFPKENVQKFIDMSKDKTPQTPKFQVIPVSKPVETKLEIEPIRNQANSNNTSNK